MHALIKWKYNNIMNIHIAYHMISPSRSNNAIFRVCFRIHLSSARYIVIALVFLIVSAPDSLPPLDNRGSHVLFILFALLHIMVFCAIWCFIAYNGVLCDLNVFLLANIWVHHRLMVHSHTRFMYIIFQ
jgi:hypothetical protein